VVNRLNAEIVRVLAIPDVRERLTAQGIEIVTSTPQELAAIIKRDADVWAKVVKATGAKLD
jgi:tripartite-type tricarboxylate transporter receptor subunit TctC